MTICLTTITHVAEEELKPLHFDTTVGLFTGSSAPRWLIPAGGEVLHQKGPEENLIRSDSGVFYHCRVAQTGAIKPKVVFSSFQIIQISIPVVTNSYSPVLPQCVLVPTSA